MKPSLFLVLLFGCGLQLATTNADDPVCPKRDKDLLIVMDSSNQVDVKYFDTEKIFVKDLIKSFNVSEGGTRFGLIIMNDHTNVWTPIHFGDCERDERCLLKKVDELKYKKAWSCIHAALDFANRSFPVENPPRDQAIVFISFGEQHCCHSAENDCQLPSGEGNYNQIDFAPKSKAITEEGKLIFAVGMNAERPNEDRYREDKLDFLRDISQSVVNIFDVNAFSIEDFEELKITQTIETELCEERTYREKKAQFGTRANPSSAIPETPPNSENPSAPLSQDAKSTSSTNQTPKTSDTPRKSSQTTPHLTTIKNTTVSTTKPTTTPPTTMMTTTPETLLEKCLKLNSTTVKKAVVGSSCFVVSSETATDGYDTWKNMGKYCNHLPGYNGRMATITSKYELDELLRQNIIEVDGYGLYVGALQIPSDAGKCGSELCVGDVHKKNWWFIDENGNRLIPLHPSLWRKSEPNSNSNYGSQNHVALERRGNELALNDINPTVWIEKVLCQYGPKPAFVADTCAHNYCDNNAICTDSKNGDGYTCKCKEGTKDRSKEFNLPDGYSCSVCSDVASDIVLLLDRSTSVGEENFAKLKRFSRKFISRFDLTKTRFALTTFHTETETYARFGECNDMECYDSRFAKINTAELAKTCMTEGLINSSALFDSNDAKRQRVLVIMTDGDPNCYDDADTNNLDSVEQVGNATKKIRSTGVTIFAVGIGSEIQNSTLKLITGDESKVLKTDFSDIQKKGIIDQLQRTVCDDNGGIKNPQPLPETCVYNHCDSNAICTDNASGKGYTCKCKDGTMDRSREHNLTDGHLCSVCTEVVSDILLLLDSSTSLTVENFNKLKQFSRKFIAHFDLTKTRFGLGTFDTAYLTHAFFDTCKTIECYDMIFRYMKPEMKNEVRKGATCMSYGFKDAYESQFLRKEDPKRQRVLIIMTDGEPYCVWEKGQNNTDTPALAAETTKKIRDSGVTVFAIGIGSDIKTSTLKLLTGDDSKVLTTEFEEIEKKGIIGELQKTVCDGEEIRKPQPLPKSPTIATASTGKPSGSPSLTTTPSTTTTSSTQTMLDPQPSTNSATATKITTASTRKPSSTTSQTTTAPATTTPRMPSTTAAPVTCAQNPCNSNSVCTDNNNGKGYTCKVIAKEASSEESEEDEENAAPFDCKKNYCVPEGSKLSFPPGEKMVLPKKTRLTFLKGGTLPMAKMPIPGTTKYTISTKLHVAKDAVLVLEEGAELYFPHNESLPLPSNTTLRFPPNQFLMYEEFRPDQIVNFYDQLPLTVPNHTRMNIPDRARLNLPPGSQFSLRKDQYLLGYCGITNTLDDGKKEELPQNTKFYLFSPFDVPVGIIAVAPNGKLLNYHLPNDMIFFGNASSS